MAVNWGRLIVGVATGYISITSLRAAFGRTDEALKKLEKGVDCPGDGTIPCKIYPAGTIESRVKRIGELVRKGSMDPRVRRLAVRSLSKTCDGDRWCTPSRDAAAELQTVLRDFKNPSSELARGMSEMDGVLAGFKKRYRYVSDHRRLDQYQSPARTLFDFHGGDCDDAVGALGALFTAVGYPVKARVYTLRGQSEPGHIALRVSPDKHGSRYITIDGSVDDVKLKGKKVPVYAGWDAVNDTNLIGSFRDYDFW